MTDEELQELRRAALAGDEDALVRLEAHLRREAGPEPSEEAPASGSVTPHVEEGDTTIGDRLREIAMSPDNLLGTAIGVGIASMAMRALGDTEGSTMAGRAVRRLLGFSVPPIPDPPRLAPRPRRRRRKRA